MILKSTVKLYYNQVNVLLLKVIDNKHIEKASWSCLDNFMGNFVQVFVARCSLFDFLKK